MCDTFVSTAPSTVDGSIIFGKNSDREPNESQSLEYYPGQTFEKGHSLDCTFISVPQADQTQDVLISRPFWMWGAEMGANSKGVVIGNEAVFTKMPYRKQGVLTGMDLLRLALERASTAEAALETIVRLLSDFGQGGLCGYQDRKLTYHNSFIICDAKEAWVLETADHIWAALKVKDHYSISNCLTIGETWDHAHPDLILHARREGWLKKGQDFNFARCYSDWLYTTFSGSRLRKACSSDLLARSGAKLDIPSAFNILRSHGEKETPLDTAFIATGLCMHAGNGLTRNSQTTGSLVAHLTAENPVFWATGTSAPCTSVFKPVWFQDPVLPDLGPVPTGTFDPASTWWRHERLHRAVMEDMKRIEGFKEERDALERAFIEQAAAVETMSRYALTEEAFKRSADLTEAWTEKVSGMPVNQKTRFVFRKYWQKQNRSAGVQI